MNLPLDARLITLLVFLMTSGLFATAQTIPDSKPTPGAPHDPETEVAFDHFYNMDYVQATDELEKIVAKHPDDAFSVNHLLTVVLMRDLYETGAMNTGDYTNDSFIGQIGRAH